MRDRAIFVGSPEDIVPLSFGKDLPAMRDWVPRHFDFAGYIIGEHPQTFGSRADAAPNGSATAPDERVCIVTVGGSGVGAHLIRRILQAYPIVQGQAARAAHDRGRGPAHRSGVASARPTASRCALSCRISIAISRPAIWRWCRAASRPAWS